jgi:RNA polymerase sigma factor (sigma-70 family)
MPEDAQAAQVVKLRFYGGLSVEETAQALGISDRTVKRDWQFARAWLFQALKIEG